MTSIRDHHHQPDPDADADAAVHWEARYTESGHMWSGAVNATTAAVVATLTPGSALDLGCGEGGDALWLAAHGWHVTGVDISATAIGRAQAAAAERGLRIDWASADLHTWQPAGGFTLVVASFFHSDVTLERTQILRRAADWVDLGGHLLLVSHAAPPPWADARAHHADLPTPEQELDRLALPAEQWQTKVAETRVRDATGPEGEQAHLEDGVVLLQRR
ncbi:MAG: class I SAM-dependent methyltransferase [Beutenbergiaceae bacterium]